MPSLLWAVKVLETVKRVPKVYPVSPEEACFIVSDFHPLYRGAKVAIATNPIIKANFAAESTDHLISIWTANDQNTYSPAAFSAIHELLSERGITLPPQQSPPKLPAPPRGTGMISLGVNMAFLAFICSTVRVSYFGVSHSTPLDSLLDLLIGGTLVAGLVIAVIGVVKKVRARAPE